MATRTGLPGSGGTHDTDGGTWRAADVDTLPGGLIGKVTTSSAQTGITTDTDLTSMTLTVTPNSSRDILIVYKVPVQLTTASSNDIGRVALLKDGSQIDGASAEFAATPLSKTQTISGQFVDESPSNSSHTYKLQLGPTNGSGTYATGSAGTNRASLYIIDVGPTF